ncbi:MAG TPA: HAD family phosphatase [Syntrophales bacterium]|nr:HAD family phosphatase [Syntrophales bacterium]
MERQNITHLFLDIGNVILTNGWDRRMRRKAAETFGLNHEEMDERHHLTFDTYEEGKLSLDEYLYRIVFYEKRSFTPEGFKAFMFSQSQPFPEMIDLIRELKSKYGLKVAAVSNEGREITEYRIKTFRLTDFVDFFVSSCFVHYRKPDADIYRIALDIAQAEPEQVVYIEDRDMFVAIANELGIRGVVHRDYATTRRALAGMGLEIARGERAKQFF